MMKPSLKQRNGGSTSLSKIVQAANQPREPPKRNVTDVLMGTLQTFYQGSDLPETDGENGVTSPTTGSSMFAGDSRESSATVVE